MSTYDDRSIKDIPDDVLRSRLSHMAHDLDKTINTEMGTPEFLPHSNREARELKKYLSKWEERSLPKDDVILWVQNVLYEAESLRNKGPQKQWVDNRLDLSKGDEILKLIQARRSVRSWTEQQVLPEAIKVLLQAATWAPSACNRQSSRYIVITEQDQKVALAKLREKWLARAPVLILVGADGRNYLPEEVHIVPYLDAAMATQNLLLMAHAIGLGAVMVKCTKRDIHAAGGPERAQAISKMYSRLNLPAYFIPVAIVAVGCPARIPGTPARLPLNRVAFFERFDHKEENQSSEGKRTTKINSLKFFIIKVIRRIAQRFGIRIYITLD